MGCDLTHLISLESPLYSQGHRWWKGAHSPTASEDRHLGISLLAWAVVAAPYPLETVTQGNEISSIFLIRFDCNDSDSDQISCLVLKVMTQSLILSPSCAICVSSLRSAFRNVYAVGAQLFRDWVSNVWNLFMEPVMQWSSQTCDQRGITSVPYLYWRIRQPLLVIHPCDLY